MPFMGAGTAIFGSGLCFSPLAPLFAGSSATDFADQFLLGFEPVDVFFVDVFLFFQQITADVVLLLFRDGDGSDEGIVFSCSFVNRRTGFPQLIRRSAVCPILAG